MLRLVIVALCVTLIAGPAAAEILPAGTRVWADTHGTRPLDNGTPGYEAVFEQGTVVRYDTHGQNGYYLKMASGREAFVPNAPWYIQRNTGGGPPKKATRPYIPYTTPQSPYVPATPAKPAAAPARPVVAPVHPAVAPVPAGPATLANGSRVVADPFMASSPSSKYAQWQLGTVIGYDARSRQYTIRLDSGKQVNLINNSQNFVRPYTGTLPAGITLYVPPKPVAPPPPKPVAPAAPKPAAPAASSGGGIPDGVYETNKISGASLISFGDLVVRGGRYTLDLGPGYTITRTENMGIDRATGRAFFRIHYTSQSTGSSDIIDCLKK